MKHFLAGLCALLLALASPAQAALSVNNLSGFGVKPPAAGGGGPAFSLAFVGPLTTSASGLTTYTFNTVDLGADVSGRVTAISVFGINTLQARTLSSGTICGNAASVISSASNQPVSGFLYLNTVGMGTSCTITITFSGAENGAGIAVYRILNPASATPVDNDCTISQASGVITISTDIPSGGAAIGGVAWVGADAANTWSGLTEDFDSSPGGTSVWTGANGGSAGTPAVITVTNTDTTPGDQSGCSASWGP